MFNGEGQHADMKADGQESSLVLASVRLCQATIL
jgi:hypothetical protein